MIAHGISEDGKLGMSINAGMSLKQARTIAVDAQKRIATNLSETGELISDNLYLFRLGQLSSVNLKVKGLNAY